MRDLNRSLRLAPRFAAGYLLRAIVLRQTGKGQAALKDLQQAVRLAPQNVWIHCHLGLQYASSRQSNLRDAAKAVKHAQVACARTERKSWVCIAALAAAYAESAQFDEAAATQSEALSLSPDERKSFLRECLTLYESGQPYRFD